MTDLSRIMNELQREIDLPWTRAAILVTCDSVRDIIAGIRDRDAEILRLKAQYRQLRDNIITWDGYAKGTEP